MKKYYISEIKSRGFGSDIEIPCWVSGKRNHKSLVFLDLNDNTGTIQAVAEEKNLSVKIFKKCKEVGVESGVIVYGILSFSKNDDPEIIIKNIEIVGGVKKVMTPSPRSDFDIFNEAFTHQMLDQRHMYLRNPKVIAILKFRDLLMYNMRNWFHENNFIAIDAPILTPVPLYEDKTAMPIEVHGEKVFLTQCVGYYLEAAVHGFEKVYNIGPSFRGEESKSKRHLMEYWHIKAEIAWGSFEDIISMVEDIIRFLFEKCNEQAQEILSVLDYKLNMSDANVPFPRISYESAINYLKNKGVDVEFGSSLSSKDEELLSEHFKSPFWITGVPRSIEPFPYVIDQNDKRITRVADLISSNGFGELLGVAEKIYEYDMLEERMRDKGKNEDPRYSFIKDVHKIGCVPHVAFGMGAERLIRWMLNIPHVRDASAFPRIFKRSIKP